MDKLTPRSLRTKANLSQRQVSQMLNVTEQTIGRWEKGSIPFLTPSQVKSLCEAFDCTIDDLIQAFEGD